MSTTMCQRSKRHVAGEPRVTSMGTGQPSNWTIKQDRIRPRRSRVNFYCPPPGILHSGGVLPSSVSCSRSICRRTTKYFPFVLRENSSTVRRSTDYSISGNHFFLLLAPRGLTSPLRATLGAAMEYWSRVIT